MHSLLAPDTSCHKKHPRKFSSKNLLDSGPEQAVEHSFASMCHRCSRQPRAKVGYAQSMCRALDSVGVQPQKQTQILIAQRLVVTELQVTGDTFSCSVRETHSTVMRPALFRSVWVTVGLASFFKAGNKKWPVLTLKFHSKHHVSGFLSSLSVDWCPTVWYAISETFCAARCDMQLVKL